MKKMKDDGVRVQTCITSPPYYGLRSYLPDNHPDKHLEIGAEKSPEEFIQKLVEVFRGVWDILEDDGTLWVNIGDSYYNYRPGAGQRQGKQSIAGQKFSEVENCNKRGLKLEGLKEKDLIGVPWMLAFALRADGWYLRQDIIWSKGSCMPECIHPNTKIYLKNSSGIILHRTMQYLWENKEDLSNFKILTPNGWKSILNIWETNKEPYSVKFSNLGTVIASGEHKFPIVHDVRRKIQHDIEVKNIRDSGDWGLCKYIGEYFDTENSEIDILKCIHAMNESKVFINSDSSSIKNKKTNGLPLWEDLAEKYNFNYKKTKNGCDTQLKTYMLKDCIPLSVCLGENFDYSSYDLISNSNSARLPSKIKADYDLGYFMGLYASEGGFGLKDDGTQYNKRGAGKLTFHKNEKDYVNFVVSYLLKFNIKSTVKITNNYCDVKFNSVVLSAFVRYFVRNKCKNKKLNMDTILNLPKDFRLGILNGMIDGDGSNRCIDGFSYTSASEELSTNFKTLSASVGIICCMTELNQKDSRNGKIYKSYTVYTSWSGIEPRPDNTIGVLPKVEKLSNDKIRMLDIEVEGHLFIIGDGIVTHNSVKDRCTKSHEYVFLLSKNKSYYYDSDAIKEPATTYDATIRNRDIGKLNNTAGKTRSGGLTHNQYEFRNKRSVWNVNPKPYSEAHFAVMPVELIEPCVLAGSRENDIIFDPFIGSGTVAEVALKHNRRYLGCDLNLDYKPLQDKRIMLENNKPKSMF